MSVSAKNPLSRKAAETLAVIQKTDILRQSSLFMNDWDFSILDKFSYIFTAVLFLVILFLVFKSKPIRNVIKILLLLLILYGIFVIVQFNINITKRDSQREINIDKRINENHNKTYWEIQKDKFKYEDLNAFFFDSNLLSSYKQLTRSVDPF